MSVEQESKRRFSRREFLKKAGIAIGAVLLSGCELPESVLEPVPVPQKPDLPIRLPQPEDFAKEQKGVLDDVVIYTDGYGLPIRCILPDGKTVNFDKAKMLGAKLNAVLLTKNGEARPLFINIIDLGKSDSKIQFKATADRPRIFEKPSDILSPEELGKYGTSIIQGKNVSLNIRKGAFEKEGPLFEQAEFFRRTGNKLTIVLVDGSALLTDYMGETKYDPVRKILAGQQKDLTDADVLAFKAKKIGKIKEDCEKSLKDLRNAVDLGESNSLNIEKHEKKFVKAAVALYTYENVLPTDQLRTIMAKPGVFAGSSTFIGTRQMPGDSTIFIATQSEKRRILTLYFNVKGDCVVTISSFGPNFAPRPSQTHPRLDDYDIKDIDCATYPEEYPVGAQDLGQSFLHEIEHLRKWIRKFLTDPGLGELKEEECSVDMESLEWIKSGFSKWRSSGYKDNSGYFFVWGIPEGGYIYTRTQTTPGVC